jgi:hypothetical protein
MQEVLLDELRANRQQIHELAAAQQRLQELLESLSNDQKILTGAIDSALLTIILSEQAAASCRQKEAGNL